MPISADGTPKGAIDLGSPSTLTLPAFTTGSGNVIVYIVALAETPILSIAGGGLIWHKRTSGLGAFYVELWYAKSVSAVSSVEFTITQTGTGAMVSTVFAFSGAKFTSPFDSGAVPIFTSNAQPMSWTTNNSQDCLVAVCAEAATIDPPWINLGVGYGGVGYRLVTCAQAGSSATWDGAQHKYAIADALVEEMQVAVSRSMPMMGAG